MGTQMLGTQDDEYYGIVKLYRMHSRDSPDAKLFLNIHELQVKNGKKFREVVKANGAAFAYVWWKNVCVSKRERVRK